MANAPQDITAALGGLPSATTIHYRVVVRTDFGTQVGNDQTFTTAGAGGGGGGATTTPQTVVPVIPIATVDQTPTVTLRLRRITLKRLLKGRKLPTTVTASEASTDVITATTPVRSPSKAIAAAKKRRSARPGTSPSRAEP